MIPRFLLRPVLVAGAVLALACAGTHPAPTFSYDHTVNFAAMKTYAWYDGPGFRMPHGDSIVDGQFVDQHVREAVDRELERKGFQKVNPGNATILVSYKSGDTGTDAEDQNQTYEWLTGNPGMTEYEKSRALTINFRNLSKKLVWTGSIQRLEGQNPGAVGREIDREVGELLSHFPPAS